MKRVACFVLFIFVLVSIGSGSAFGQATASGTIQGTVTDKSGGAVAGALVVIKNKGTDLTHSMTTPETGYYRFDFLPVAVYSVTVTKTGFSTFVETVEILVGQTSTVNVELQTGAMSEIVEVTSEAPIVDQLKTDVSTNITPSEVEQLPMLGHDVADLAYLAPGVKATDSYDPTKSRYAILSVNGANGRNVNVTVNGIDNKDNTVGGPVMQLPSEAVQEFKISTQRFSAENGRSEGAAINMITKSGTNTYHGSLFGYFRATNLSTDEKVPDGVGGVVKQHPNYSHQQFGGTVGGPIIKDKLFVFFDLEREREHQGLAEDPSVFTEFVIAKNAGFAVQPAATVPRPFFEWRYNGRLDYKFSDRETAYVSYTSQDNSSLNDQSDSFQDLTAGNFTTNHLQLANFTLNSVLSNTTVNQFTAGWQYWNNVIDSTTRAPLFTFPGGGSGSCGPGGSCFGTNGNVPQQSFQRKWQFKDDFSKTVGNHTLKAGVDYIWNPVEGGFFEFNSTLEIDFSANPSTITTDAVNYPQGFSTPGAVTSMSIANGDPRFIVATKQLGLYAQDDWKVNRRLSLNLGLRWDKDFNMIGGSDIKNSRTYLELVAINSPISNPYINKIAKDDNKDFSPRVGFAYDLTGRSKHVVRGGFGLYYGNVFQNIPLFMEQMSNPTVFQTVLSLSAPADPVPGTGKTLGQWQYGVDPLPTIPPPSTQLATGSVGRLMDPHYRNPVTEEFNGGYSWAISTNTAFETEYTHVLGLHENRTINIDQKIPDLTQPIGSQCCYRPLTPAFAAAGQPRLNSVRNEESIGRSHYDGINFIFRQRMAHRYTLNANYTLAWANSYDAGGSSFRNYPRLSTNPFASYEWGPSANDERHHVTISGIIDLPKGFQLSPIMQYGSGRPYNLSNSSNTLNTGGGSFNAVVVPTSDPRNFLAFAGNNTGAQDCFYGINGVTQGCTIAKYDPLRGNPFFELDMRLAKNIRFGERMNLQLIAQAFNLTNRGNYGGDFSTNISSAATFRHPAGFLNPSGTTMPRAVWGEFGAKFTF